ncbi:MAG: hypothetical protein OEY01_00410 [Desulfobulbaceae bacterium]|nr:hypothetical protein [Desulfobulbaceae bacterium]HIJ77753.1 hypothetical protein [Deltaproteobacteria bacterium]
MAKLFIVVLLSLSVVGCAATQPNWANRSAKVNKNSPVVYIYPLNNGYQEASVAVLPFQVPAQMSLEQGRGVATLFKDVLLGRQAFSRVLCLDESYGSMERAIAIGKRAGVDLVLVGKVNYAMEGGQFGGSRVEVASRLVNVNTGNTVWYIEQALDQPMNYPKSSTLSRFVAAFNPPAIGSPAGGPVVPNMLAQVAFDMVDVMAGARFVSR